LDPIAESFYYVTPYNYAENSPIANIDLWGLQALNFNQRDLIRAATSEGVNQSTQRFNQALNNIGYVSIGTQGAGLGAEVKLGPVEAGAKALFGSVEANSDLSVSANVVKIEAGVTVKDIGPQGDLTVGNIEMNATGVESSAFDAALGLGLNKASVQENKVGFAIAYADIFVSAGVNLDAIGEAVNSTVSAVQGFFKSLFTESTNNSFNTSSELNSSEDFIRDKYDID
jgi:hypothetical protein